MSYRDDLVASHERILALERENEKLLKKMRFSYAFSWCRGCAYYDGTRDHSDLKAASEKLLAACHRRSKPAPPSIRIVKEGRKP